MGNNFATEMTDGTLEDLGIHLTLRQQISIQLTSNHYPPVPLIMVEACVEAIELARLGYYTADVKLPINEFGTGERFQITWNGQHTAPVSVMVETYHLDGFINTADGEE